MKKNIFFLLFAVLIISLNCPEFPFFDVEKQYESLPALLYYFKFDSNDNSLAIDYSGNNKHGNILGAVLSDEGKVGKSFSFTYNGSRVELAGYTPNGQFYSLNNLSILVWIKLINVNLSETYHIVGDGNAGTVSYRLNIKNGKVNYLMNDNNSWLTILQSNSILSAGQWYHIALTYNGGTCKLYINGVLDNTGSIAMKFNTSANIMTIGSQRSGSSAYDDYFDGYIDELKMYSSIISEAEIIDYYNLTK
jgi:hypothetical protein